VEGRLLRENTEGGQGQQGHGPLGRGENDRQLPQPLPVLVRSEAPALLDLAAQGVGVRLQRQDHDERPGDEQQRP